MPWGLPGGPPRARRWTPREPCWGSAIQGLECCSVITVFTSLFSHHCSHITVFTSLFSHHTHHITHHSSHHSSLITHHSSHHSSHHIITSLITHHSSHHITHHITSLITHHSSLITHHTTHQSHSDSAGTVSTQHRRLIRANVVPHQEQLAVAVRRCAQPVAAVYPAVPTHGIGHTL